MRRNTIFWGGLLILLGVLELLSALDINLMGADPGKLFWPLFFLLLGGWIVIGVLTSPRSMTESVQIERKDAERAVLRLTHGAGTLNLGAGADAGQLVTGEFVGGVFQATDYGGGRARIDLRSQSNVHFRSPVQSNDWTMRLAADLPFDLEVRTGASESDLDLSSLRVPRLDLKTGASSTRLTLPAAGQTEAHVNAGAASLTVRIPDGVAARIRVRSGVGTVDVNTRRFPRSEGYYQSPDYETAANRVDLKINAGVGSISVS